MKKWSKVIFSIWLVFFSITMTYYLLTSSVHFEFLITLMLTSLIYFLLVMFETMKKK